MAVTEMDLSPSEFWELTWYDWILYSMRYNKQVEKLRIEREIQWDHTRNLIAMIHNTGYNRAKKGLTPEGIIKLSFDKGEEQQEAKPDPDIFRKLKQQFGSRIKHGSQ